MENGKSPTGTDATMDCDAVAIFTTDPSNSFTTCVNAPSAVSASETGCAPDATLPITALVAVSITQSLPETTYARAPSGENVAAPVPAITLTPIGIVVSTVFVARSSTETRPL